MTAPGTDSWTIAVSGPTVEHLAVLYESVPFTAKRTVRVTCYSPHQKGYVLSFDIEGMLEALEPGSTLFYVLAAFAVFAVAVIAIRIAIKLAVRVGIVAAIVLAGWYTAGVLL